MSKKPSPHPTADSVDFWHACSEGRLTFQRCGSCNHAQLYPRSLCARCGSTELTVETSQGRGTIFTFTLNHRAPNEAFAADAPYLIALIDLDEGPRIMTNVVDCDPASVAIGSRVRIVFEARGELSLPQSTLLE